MTFLPLPSGPLHLLFNLSVSLSMLLVISLFLGIITNTKPAQGPVEAARSPPPPSVGRRASPLILRGRRRNVYPREARINIPSVAGDARAHTQACTDTGDPNGRYCPSRRNCSRGFGIPHTLAIPPSLSLYPHPSFHLPSFPHSVSLLPPLSSPFIPLLPSVSSSA